jgi:hypothetical protein
VVNVEKKESRTHKDEWLKALIARRKKSGRDRASK